MKSMLLSVALATSSLLAMAEPVVVPAEKFTSVPELAAKCQPDCLILDRADFEALKREVQKLANQAFEAGKRAQAEKPGKSI